MFVSHFFPEVDIDVVVNDIGEGEGSPENSKIYMIKNFQVRTI